MARPLKARMGEAQHFAMAEYIRSAKAPYPSEPRLLQAIVRALLFRLKLHDPTDARFRSVLIRTFAIFERHKENPPVMRDGTRGPNTPKHIAEAYTGLYRRLLMSSMPRRQPHLRETLLLQRDWLTQYLQKVRNWDDISYRRLRVWLRKNGSAVYRVASSVPCICAYRDSLDGLTDDDLVKVRGASELIVLLLAELHTSTPAAIRKILSHRKVPHSLKASSGTS